MATTQSHDGALQFIQSRQAALRDRRATLAQGRVDPQLLAALADGTIAFSDLPDDVLEACRQSIGTDGLADLLLERQQRQFAAYSSATASRSFWHRSRGWMAVAASAAIVAGAATFFTRPKTPGVGDGGGGTPAVALAWNPFDPHAYSPLNIPTAPIAPGLPDFNADTTATLGSATAPHRSWQLATVIVRSPDGFGSGAFVGGQGWVITNYHVVAEVAQNASLTGETPHLQILAPREVDGHLKPSAPMDAILYRVDAVHDLALLKLANLPAGVTEVPHFDLAGHVDDQADCFVIGSQYNGPAWWVRAASISQQFSFPDDLTQVAAGMDQGHAMLDRNRIDVIATDARISEGDSGGPLLSADGKLIGLTFATSANHTAGSVGWHIALPQIKAFLANMPAEPEAVPFDIFTAGLPEASMLAPDDGSAGDSDTSARTPTGAITYRFADDGDQGQRAVAEVSYITFDGGTANGTLRTAAGHRDAASTGDPTAELPAGLWGMPGGTASFDFELCVVRRADGKTIVGYANADHVVDEIRIGGGGQRDRAAVIWRRAADGAWRAATNADEPLVDTDRLGTRHARQLARMFGSGRNAGGANNRATANGGGNGGDDAAAGNNGRHAPAARPVRPGGGAQDAGSPR